MPEVGHNQIMYISNTQTNAQSETEKIGRTLFLEEFGKHLNHVQFTEGYYDTTDLYCVMMDSDNMNHNIVADIKAYRDTEHPRPYAKVTPSGYKYDNYMIDLKKIMDIVIKSKEKVNGEAMLFVFFSDRTLVWNFTDEYWRKIAQRSEPRLVNYDGRNYGQSKEWAMMTYLKREEAVYENVYQS